MELIPSILCLSNLHFTRVFPDLAINSPNFFDFALEEAISNGAADRFCCHPSAPRLACRSTVGRILL